MASQTPTLTDADNKAVFDDEKHQPDYTVNNELKSTILDEEKAPSDTGRSDSDKEDAVQQKIEEPVNPMHPSQFPDGGAKAWLCVAGSAACFFCSFGWINAVGVFQNYYESVPLRE